jgi:3-methylfumaryl-CoA hydratase
MNASEIDSLRGWIGRSERCSDVVTDRLVLSLRSTLDLGWTSAADTPPLPVALHWCLAPQIEPRGSLGSDGHPRRGGFLPPVSLTRRMWAASQVRLVDELRIGDVVERASRVVDVSMKSGRAGILCFVVVQHEWATARGLAVQERQDIVYADTRSSTAAAESPPPIAAAGVWQREIRTDPVLLFRYSALTFNGHRFHYDHDYCRTQEGYAGLIVHGPLQATYALELARVIRAGRTPRHFTFRATSPLIESGHFVLHAIDSDDGLKLWVQGADGRQTMSVTATW